MISIALLYIGLAVNKIIFKLSLYSILKKNKIVSTDEPKKDDVSGAIYQTFFLSWSKTYTSSNWAQRNAIPDPNAILMEIKSENNPFYLVLAKVKFRLKR